MNVYLFGVAVLITAYIVGFVMLAQGRGVWRALQIYAFYHITIVYFVSNMAVWPCIVAQNLFGHTFSLATRTYLGMSVVALVFSAIAWGLVAGIMTYRRGWQMGGRRGPSELIGFVLMDTIWAYVTMAMAATSYHRRKIFFPTPSQIGHQHNW